MGGEKNSNSDRSKSGKKIEGGGFFFVDCSITPVGRRGVIWRPYLRNYFSFKLRFVGGGGKKVMCRQ